MPRPCSIEHKLVGHPGSVAIVREDTYVQDVKLSMSLCHQCHFGKSLKGISHYHAGGREGLLSYFDRNQMQKCGDEQTLNRIRLFPLRDNHLCTHDGLSCFIPAFMRSSNTWKVRRYTYRSYQHWESKQRLWDYLHTTEKWYLHNGRYANSGVMYTWHYWKRLGRSRG